MLACIRVAALAAIVVPFLAGSGWAQERRILTTEGADYFGGDYDVRKDVDLQACQAACIGDAQCRAFTFNAAAGWCFLKNEVGELRSVAGAISGRIATESAPTADVEAQRIGELTFLPQSFLDEARRLAGRVGEAPPDTRGMSAIIQDATDAMLAGTPTVAADRYLAALRLEPGRFDLWSGYTRALLAASSDNWEVQQKLRE